MLDDLLELISSTVGLRWYPQMQTNRSNFISCRELLSQAASSHSSVGKCLAVDSSKKWFRMIHNFLCVVTLMNLTLPLSFENMDLTKRAISVAHRFTYKHWIDNSSLQMDPRSVGLTRTYYPARQIVVFMQAWEYFRAKHPVSWTKHILPNNCMKEQPILIAEC
jgi:hypothetical protein